MNLQPKHTLFISTKEIGYNNYTSHFANCIPSNFINYIYLYMHDIYIFFKMLVKKYFLITEHNNFQL